MYVSTVKVRDREYVRIVESVRVDGKPRPRVVANLGNLDKLRGSVPTIIRGLHRLLGEPDPLEDLNLENLDHAEWGVSWVAKEIWEELGIRKLLRRLFRTRGATSTTEILARTMVANRLSEPTSKLGIARWLEDVSIGPAEDKFFAAHRDNPFALADRFYKAMDSLYRHRAAIERHLFERLKDLFHLRVDTVFYDITSSYFEGLQAEYGWFGYSRDEKRKNVQIVVGLMLVDGFPVGHQVFKGFRRDSSCLETALRRIERRFRVGRVILVGDRGFLTEKNIKLLQEHNHEYILACRKRQDVNSRAALRSRPDVPIYADEAIAGREDPAGPVIWSIEGKNGDRLIGCTNPVVARRDRKRRGDILTMFREELAELQRQLKKNRRQGHDRRVARLAELLARRNQLGKRYFFGEIDDQGQLRYRTKQSVLKYEALLDGTTVLRTNTRGMTDEQIVQRYKELARIERCFRNLKSFIDLRPIHHRVARRISAHVFICMLSLLFERIIDRRLKAAAVDVTAERALQVLKRVRRLRDSLNGVEIERVVALGDDTRQIVRAPGLSDPNPLIVAR